MLRWPGRPTADKLTENSAFGIGITAVTSVLGFVFWVVAARFYPVHAVGVATALIAAMTLASTLSNLGVGLGLVQRLPTCRSDREWSVAVNTGLLLCIASGLIAGVVTVVVLPLISEDLAIVRTSAACALMLVLGIVLWTLSTAVDFLFVAERTVRYGFARNTAFSLLKLALVVVIATTWTTTALGLYSAGVISSAIALAGAIVIGGRRLSHRWMLVVTGARSESRAMAGSLIWHHLTNIGAYLPVYLLPLIVTARLGAVANAWAYIGWMFGAFALTVSPTVSASLYAEGSHDRASFNGQARKALILIILLLIPMMIATALFGRMILGLFGADYARHSFGLLVVLVPAAIPDAITNVFVTTLRVRHRLRAAAIMNMAMGVSAVVLAWFLVVPLGVAGIAWSWLIAQCAGSVYAITVLATGGLRERPELPPEDMLRSTIPAEGSASPERERDSLRVPAILSPRESAAPSPATAERRVIEEPRWPGEPGLEASRPAEEGGCGPVRQP